MLRRMHCRSSFDEGFAAGCCHGNGIDDGCDGDDDGDGDNVDSGGNSVDGSGDDGSGGDGV